LARVPAATTEDDLSEGEHMRSMKTRRIGRLGLTLAAAALGALALA